MKKLEYKSDLRPTKDLSQLTLRDKLWSVHCRDFQANKLYNKGTALNVHYLADEQHNTQTAP